jgi:hypothetical protein
MVEVPSIMLLHHLGICQRLPPAWDWDWLRTMPAALPPCSRASITLEWELVGVGVWHAQPTRAPVCRDVCQCHSYV